MFTLGKISAFTFTIIKSSLDKERGSSPSSRIAGMEGRVLYYKETHLNLPKKAFFFLVTLFSLSTHSVPTQIPSPFPGCLSLLPWRINILRGCTDPQTPIANSQCYPSVWVHRKLKTIASVPDPLIYHRGNMGWDCVLLLLSGLLVRQTRSLTLEPSTDVISLG